MSDAAATLANGSVVEDRYEIRARIGQAEASRRRPLDPGLSC